MNRIHGHAAKGNPTATYSSWAKMIQRCTNSNDPKYSIYGGRGILIDPEWFDFSNFLRDMGEKPEGMELDRIDSNGDYTPDNCRWTDSVTQQNNKRNVRLFTFGGETKTVKEWSEVFGINLRTINSRLRRGWSVEKALTTPIKRVREDL